MFSLITSIASSQKIDSVKFGKLLNNKFAEVDFSDVFKSSPYDIVGFIGTNYQRFQIYYSSITKDEKNPNVYYVKGESMVKNNICDFSGTITIIKVVENEQYTGDLTHPTMVNLDSTRECEITAHYLFKEDSTEKYTGIFEGDMVSDFYLDINYKAHYDDLMAGADGYSNNQYTGTWTSYDMNTKKPCNWGDYRIPNSGDLDVGTGNFSPNKKYIKNGWEDFAWYTTGDANKPKEWWKTGHEF